MGRASPFYAGDVTQNGLNEEFPTGIIENIEHVTVSYGLELGVNYVLEKHNLVAGLVYDSTELKDASKEANYTNVEK